MTVEIDAQAWLDLWLPGAEIATSKALGSGVVADVLGVRYSHQGRSAFAALRVLRAAGARVALERLAALHVRLGRAGLPVPEPYAVVELGEQVGLWMAWLPGEVALDGDPQAFADILRQIHAVDVSGLPLSTWQPVDVDVAAIPAGNMPVEMNVEAVLAPPPPLPGRAVLVHGDFWPGNLLLDGGRVSAVLDWEDAALGHALLDAAHMRYELMWLSGADAANHFTDAYLRNSGYTLDDLAPWVMCALRTPLAGMHRWGLPQADRERLKHTMVVLSRSI